MKTRSFFRSLLLLAAPSMMFANPQGLQVMSGEAALSQQSHTLEVTTGNQAILHWDSFSISEQETTRFVMPSSSSTVLNRVLGGDLSQIMGTLEANGKVFLINPKGVLVGKNAQVDTSSFIASSFDVLDSDFLQGKDIAFKGEGGSVVNLGKIHAWDGDIFLVGYQVTNEGALDAEKGVAALAAGTEVLMRPAGDERVLIRAHLTEAKQEIGVHNTGTITALQAELKADGNPYKFAVKDAGTINALQKVERNGKIFLVATDGAVEAKGHYNAASGEVQVLGNWVRVDGDATIDVSGVQGGSVLVGGDYQGLNPEIQNSDVTYVGPNVRINADALENGDGGKVILWGNKGTGFFGSISAGGGAQGGNGGFIEVSSREYLAAEGPVSAFSPMGNPGTLLYDPCAITISTAADSGDTFSGCPAGTYSFSGATSHINNTTLENNLNTCSVTIDATASGTATTGSITFVANPFAPAVFTWSGATTLTLITKAASAPTGSDFILINNGIQSTSSSGNLNLVSSSIAFNSGGFIGTNVSTIGGNLSVSNSGAFSVGRELNVAGTTSLNLTGECSLGPVGIFSTNGVTTITSGTYNQDVLSTLQGSGSLNLVCGSFTTTGQTQFGGPVNIQCSEMTVNGGEAGSYISSSDSCTVVSSGTISVLGGSDNGLASIGAASVAIQAPELIIQGGTGMGAFASVATSSGNISIDGTASTGCPIQLTGGTSSDGSSPAQIEAGGAVLIGQTMGLDQPTNITLSGMGDGAMIIAGSEVSLTATGTLLLEGGTGATSPAQILAQTGNVTVDVPTCILENGTGASAQGIIQSSTGTVFISATTVESQP